jgi:hypothetical protein
MLPNGEIAAQFLQMRIKHDRLIGAHKVFDSMRKMKIDAPWEPQRFSCIFAPTGSGKSTTVKDYIETVIVDYVIARGLFPANMNRKEIAHKQHIALHVTLAAKATEKSFASDILTAFGDPRASRGTKDSMLGRAYDYIGVKGSQIMFIDEVQHLDHRYEADQKKKSSRVFSAENSSVTDMMKVIMIRGRIPIVFLGIEGARNLILGDDQMNMRNLGEIDFRQLRPERPAEQRMFVRYLGCIGILMQQCGIFPKESDLVSGDIPAKIHEVVSGRVGTASNLILAAATIARERGADQLLETHLLAAVDEWAIPAKLISYNPFRSGIRQRELRAA